MENGTMKILTVCNGGNCRSVTLASMIKQEGVEAISIGVRTSTKETVKLLADWADKIIVVADGQVMKRFPNGYAYKLIYMDIGKDKWEQAMHPQLVNKIKQALQQTVLKELKIRTKLHAS